MIIQTLLLLLPLATPCPLNCICDHDVVNCASSLLEAIPRDLPIATRVLNLYNNRLSSLTETNLTTLPNLEELYIQNNMISSIHQDAFRNNVKLKLLDVRDNPDLRNLQYQLVQNTQTLNKLFANNIDCGCGMALWHYRQAILQERGADIDILCASPSMYRGARLDALPSDIFESCGNCNPGELECLDGGCVSEEFWCDGNFDCNDSSDETSCPTDAYTELDCDTSDMFQCGNEGCVPHSWVCDDYDDCGDLSDEAYCNGNATSTCAAGELQCLNLRCVSLAAQCDSINDCGDWWDESKFVCGDADSREVCAAGWTMCRAGGGCIHHSTICDGVQHCSDGQDELGCDNCTRRCQINDRCIKDSWLCDSIPDCPDASDEWGCDYGCPEGSLQCGGGGCVSCEFVCDGFPDCRDALDEKTCNVCNSSICLEAAQEKTGITMVVIIATTVSACISITSVVLFIMVYRQRRKSLTPPPPVSALLHPPLYTDIEFGYRVGSGDGAQDGAQSPPPRYKSEPDIAGRLMGLNEQLGHACSDSEGE